ncbi:Gfo/Idh/MocA family oxidoreductase [Micromonospora sp. KC606]|uniref:Gfo/Idh/MocA family protein n=1 Tax=Micromonospora sp. KC606 TaxID=2530379 RepID=UPI001054088F|nr:Gfo/Idh/MocA family oxidoreductase [Micromonospora sp. KC606]TDC85512.1 Gfo/Idh/MocA family oxidoreductase [Micromonospora sp. KC606]
MNVAVHREDQLSSSPRLRCILIGVGRRALEDYVPALVDLSETIDFVAACDVDPTAEARLAAVLGRRAEARPLFFTDRTAALDATRPDLAVIATPHHTHLEVAKNLILRGVPLLKEKPFAISLTEAHELAHLVWQHDGHVRLCVQRRYHPLYLHAKEALAELGQIRHFDASYQLNANAYHDGWRASPETAGGGAIIDMGYHIVDLLHWFFGVPSVVYATTAPKLVPTASYTIEETVLANVRYDNGTTGTLRLSLCEAAKEETIRVYGTKGHITLRRDLFERYDRSNNRVENLIGDSSWASTTDVLVDTVARLRDSTVVTQEVTAAVDITAVIESLYHSIAQQAPVKPMRQETCSDCYNARRGWRSSGSRPTDGVSLAQASPGLV